MSNLTEKLVSEFSDREYAHAYMQSHTVSRIAAQVHAIRKQRGWSQSDLAKAADITQERVSKIESADFESVTLKTLNKFAEAFDVHLQVAFVSFSQGIVDVANLSPTRLEVKPRDQDLSSLTENRATFVRDNDAWTIVDSPIRNVVTPIYAISPAQGAKQDGRRQLNTEWQGFAAAEV